MTQTSALIGKPLTHGLITLNLFERLKMELKANDTETWLETIWDALHKYRDKCIPEGELAHDDEWSDICTAMAWLQEELEVTDN